MGVAGGGLGRSYELLMMVIRRSQAVPDGVSGGVRSICAVARRQVTASPGT
jgi:hypothetical protein